MKGCREIEPLLTAYVDGEGAAGEEAVVREHLAGCAPCRALAEAERSAREWLRGHAAELRGTAPDALAVRCRALCGTATRRSRWMMPAALAASLAVVVGALAVFVVGNERRALAAELTADHERCFSHAEHAPLGRSVQIGELTVTVPDGDVALGLQLTGLRQCRIRRTVMAHALYRSQGRPVSLYVAPAEAAFQIPEIMGTEVRTWVSAEACYALVGRVPAAEMDRLATFLRGPAGGP